jgi:hypothetical protein
MERKKEEEKNPLRGREETYHERKAFQTVFLWPKK